MIWIVASGKPSSLPTSPRKMSDFVCKIMSSTKNIEKKPISILINFNKNV